ncbi:hypothetical protein [Ralstonia phage RSP15]|uniref:metal-dependent phosphohydrolase n=1 Tax=Ralstonia phage RSP15 TaxID=1785960 RepID=UPI00074D3FF0|nr:metal-dependent phosphohydrolase [Ralstonia phage RSP15]BAU40057.1 hypothetical protein [Ralstonia phage RSP15]
MKKGELLSKMIHLAVIGHFGQFDQGGNPYILHCLAVLNLLDSDDEEVQCMAVGHDLIEDTDMTYQKLREEGMTERIISGIRCLTKLPGETYEEYKARVKSNPDSVLVKMADLTHNSDIRRLKGVRDKDIQRMVRYHTFFLELKTIKEK